MSGEFEGKVVAVTGAGRGVGRSVAEAFVDQGAKVAIGARTVSYGEQAVADIEARGGEAIVSQVDVTVRADLEKLVHDAVDAFGGLDVVVHSASEAVTVPMAEMTDDDLEKMLASSIKASFWLTQAARPHLAKASDSGRIVLLSSIAGTHTAIYGLTGYGAAKAGIKAFIEAAALELAGEGIRINGIEPGTIDSDRSRRVMTREQLDGIAGTIPLRRLVSQEEIADIALFLCSAKAEYLTGTNITIDGGQSLSTMDVGADSE